MTQTEGERRVKSLQKEFLIRIEQHPIFQQLDPQSFNSLRKRVFRGTFSAYRLGLVGMDGRESNLYAMFFGWLEDAFVLRAVDPTVRVEVTELCFRTALESYRIGSMVAAE